MLPSTAALALLMRQMKHGRHLWHNHLRHESPWWAPSPIFTLTVSLFFFGLVLGPKVDHGT